MRHSILPQLEENQTKKSTKNRYPEPFKRLLIAISDRSLTAALEILESELGLSDQGALEFLRRFQACGYSFSQGGER